MKTIQYFLLTSLLIITTNVFAGGVNTSLKARAYSAEEQKTYDKAEKNFAYEEFQEALSSFLSLADQNPDDLDLNFHVGMCYFYLHDETKAAPYLEKASIDRALQVRILFLKKLSEKSNVIL
jgi:tetratricopeptide (TPR) repeat protein